MRALFERVGNGPDLSETWREILSIVRHCKELNDINGAVSRVRQEHTLAALATLRGHEQQPALYGPAGRQDSGYEQRGIGLI